MLSVNPIVHMSANVLTIDAGMAMAAMTVDRQLRRKASTTSAARKAPITRCSCTFATAALMWSE